MSRMAIYTSRNIADFLTPLTAPKLIQRNTMNP